MIVVDTSVWIDHFRGGRRSSSLVGLLERGEVATHPFVVGELAVGNLGRRRAAILEDLRLLPEAPLLTESDVHELVLSRRLSGSGIGWLDAHLLAASLVAGFRLWSLDAALADRSAALGIAPEA